MPIVVVGGSGRNVGKTSLVCGLIAALPEFEWTAMKITSHAHGGRDAIWEETSEGKGTDSGRCLAAGARRAFLVTAIDEELPITEIQAAIGVNANVIFESNWIVSALKPDLCIGVMGGLGDEMKLSFKTLMDRADALVIAADRNFGSLELPLSAEVFRLARFGCMSSEMVEWTRVRLNLSQ